MTLDVLAEAWPSEYKLPKTTPSAPENDAAASTSNPFPSLADLSLKPAVEHGIKTGETEELEGLVWLPGKAKSIKSVLQRQNPFPDSGLSLLAKVVQHEIESDKTGLDLSGFPLSDSQIVSLLTLMEKGDVERLNLSPNPNISIDVLRHVLSTSTKFRRLILLDTSISSEQIYQLLVDEPKLFYNLEELVHPALFSWQDPAEYPPRFTYVGLGQNAPCAVSLAIFTPATVVQSLTDFLSAMSDSDGLDSYGIVGSSLVPQAAFSTAVRRGGEPWGKRRVHCFPALINSPFDKPGWLFAASLASYGASAHRYGFVRIDTTEGTPKRNICDLGGFLKEMASEGRPLPSDEAIKKLEEIFTKLDSKGAKLWTDDDPEFLPFMRDFNRSNSHRY